MQLTQAEVMVYAIDAGATWSVDPFVLGGIWWLESSWRPDVVNEASWATGLGGVLSRESVAVYGSAFANRPTVEALKDPATNADWSARILSGNLAASDGDLYTAVRNYSGGWRNMAAEYETRYWKPLQAKMVELRKEAKTVTTEARDTAARWHAEEAVRQIEAAIAVLQEARQRLLDQTIYLLSS